jgi:hypothetical protein
MRGRLVAGFAAPDANAACKAAGSHKMQNVIDLATGRPWAKPAAFAQSYELFERSGLRRRSALDLVDVVVTVTQDVGRKLSPIVKRLRAESLASYRSKEDVIEFGTGKRVAAGRASLPAPDFSRYPEGGAGAWALEVRLARYAAEQLIAELEACGVEARYDEALAG